MPMQNQSNSDSFLIRRTLHALSIVGVLLFGLFVLTQASLAQGQVKSIDSGFNPKTHAFGFENYGGDPKIVNLTAIEMVRMFGDKVCASKQNGTCTLSPVAKQWMNGLNQAMKGGHCEGMAVLSALFYTGKLKPDDFGAPQVAALKFAGNEKLQREIAYWFTTQATQPTLLAVIKVTPKEIVAKLTEAFAAGAKADTTYSIGIYKRDGTGGHAVTPIAIQDKGDGITDILVYDNNYPGVTRAITVDLNADTWQYEASTNPSVQADLYEGDATTKTLDLTPSTPRLQMQACSFCENATSSRLPGLAAPATQYNKVSIWGEGAHVVITDGQGHKLGYVNGKWVNEIPGALIQRFKESVDPWARDDDPVYYIPTNVKFTITLDGSALKHETVAELSLIGPGYALDVQDIKLTPGQIDLLDVSPDGAQFSYKPGSNESPDLIVADEGKDGVDYEFYLKGFEIEKGGTINVNLDTTKGQLRFNTIGNQQAGKYEVGVSRYDDKSTQEFGGELTLQPDDTVYVDYAKWQGKGKPVTVELDHKSDGTIDETIELEDQLK